MTGIYQIDGMAFLTHIDAGRHMYRWYHITIQPTLLDDIAVICEWGSLRTGYRRARILPVESQEKAKVIFEKILKTRLKHGYVLV